MKYVAILLIVITLAAGGVVVYALLNTSLAVEGQGFQAISASERANEFLTLQSVVERNALQGVVYRDAALDDPGKYTYYVYTLRLHNKCLVAAEMVEMQVSPAQADVLMYGESNEVIIPAGATRDVWCAVVTEGAPVAARDITVTYYLCGNPNSVRFTHAGNP